MIERTRFAVVSEGRTGSNLLASMLETHPNVRMYGELFNRSDYRVMDLLDRQGVLLKVGEDPIEFLEERIFDEPDPDVMAIGFKLMYHQAKDSSWNKIWRHVRKSFKVIHLKRKNLLDRYLSLKLAIRSQQTVAYGLEEVDYPYAVTIDPLEFQKAIEDSLAARRECDIILKHSDTLEVFYEDLDLRRDAQSDRIQDFLGVPFAQIDPTTLRQRRRPQSEMIENYDDLRAHFAGKPQEEFFTG